MTDDEMRTTLIGRLERFAASAERDGDRLTSGLMLNAAHMLALTAVKDSAREVMADEAVDAWLDYGINMLGGSPRQAVREGRHGQVLAMLEGLKDGVVW